MRLILFLITLSLIFATQLSSADSEIELRAKDYCSSLRGQNISHYSVRKGLKGFFRSDEELSDYIVNLYYIMNDKKLRNFNVLDCNIIHIQRISENQAEVEYQITGKWILFLHKDIKITAKWERENGIWFIIPHEILNKE